MTQDPKNNEQLRTLLEEGASHMLNTGAFPTPYTVELLCRRVENVSWTIVPFSTQMFIDSQNFRAFVYVKLNWIGRVFSKKVILTTIQESLLTVVPYYEFRVVCDPNLLKKVEELLGRMNK